jgi:hypothetical protein
MDLPILTLLDQQHWTIAAPPHRLALRVPDVWLAHTRTHTPEVLGETGFVVLPRTNLAADWMGALDDAATAATLAGARWALLADQDLFVVTDAWKRLALPDQRVAWMDTLSGPRASAWLASACAGKGFPNAQERRGEWTHWMAPLGQTEHDGDANNPQGPTAWLQAHENGRFVLLAGSRVAHRLTTSLIQRPDSVARLLAARASVGLRATMDSDVLATCQDSAPMARSVIATLVLGREANGQIAGQIYGNKGRNDRDIWPK